jgi:hypothetical protein
MDGARLMRRFGEETIAFGGMPLRRADAARIAAAWAYCAGDMDRFVWAKPAWPGVAPLRLAEAAAIMGLGAELVGTQ